jgi:hypothetical protein
MPVSDSFRRGWSPNISSGALDIFISVAYILLPALVLFFRYSTPSVCRTILEKRSKYLLGYNVV